MTRAEWIIHYRRVRSERVKDPSRHMDECVLFLKEFYFCTLDPAEETFCWLVDRYRSQLREWYFEEYDRIKARGKLRTEDHLKGLVFQRNPFFALLPKEESWRGSYIPFPKV